MKSKVAALAVKIIR